MIYGVVHLRREATLPLVVSNSNGQRQVVDTVIDTGFSGFLSLPSAIITTLYLPWSASDIVTLGDGSETLFDLYTASVIWDGLDRIIDVAASDADPLVGMGLLYAFKLQIEAVEGGYVTIEVL